MTLSVRLDEDLDGRVEALANERKKTPNWIMNEAIRQYLEKEELRASFHKEALEARTHFRETGLHLTATETQVWLESWGSPDEAEAPECHK